MPISGHKEIGVNTFARHSSDYLMGVPIKKRKFPYIRPLSPDPVSQSEQQHTKLKPEQSSSSTARTPTKISLSASISPTSSQEENRQASADPSVKSSEINDAPALVSHQEPTNKAAALGAGFETCSKTTPVVASHDNTVVQKIVASTELKLTPSRYLEKKVEEDMRDQRVPLKNDIPYFSVNGVTLLAHNKFLFSDLAVENSERVREEEKLDPSSWNLALTERQTSSQSNCNHLQANRTHWDLNTMMETWDGSTNHSGLGVDDKCAIHSNRTLQTESDSPLVVSGKKTLQFTEDKSTFSTLSPTSYPQPKNDILFHLSLSTSTGLQVGCSQEPLHTSSSPKVDSSSGPSSCLNLSKNMLSSSNLNLAGSRIVKSEPSDEINNQEFQGVEASSLSLGENKTVKTESRAGYCQEHQTPSKFGNLKSITHGPVKSEPICGPLLLSSKVLSARDVSNCMMPLPIMMHPLSNPISLGLCNNAEASCQISTSVIPSALEDAQKPNLFSSIAADLVSESVCTDVGSEVADEKSSFQRVEALHVVDPQPSSTKSTNKLQSDSHGNSDIAESDEDKINIFDDMQDDCSSDIDNESEGNHVGVVVHSEDKHLGGEDDDYEDGEVREPLVCNAVGVEEDMQHVYNGISDSRGVNISGYPADGIFPEAVFPEVRDIRLEGAIISEEFDGSQFRNKHDHCITQPKCSQEATVVVAGAVGTEKTEPRDLVNYTRKQDELKGYKDLCNGTVSVSHGISPGDDLGSTVSQHENDKSTKPGEAKVSVRSKTGCITGDEATKDSNAKGNQSRIINLARAFSGSSPGRMRSFPGRFLPSRIERERFDGGVHNGDKLHPRGSRDDGSMDDRNKFERQRNQDQQTGSDFMHGLGRPDERFDSTHGDWDFDYNFAPKYFICLTTYRINGPKNAAAVMVTRDATLVGAGRKPLRDDLPNFRHPHSRRRSPGGRGRPVSHGVELVRRSARDISPDRCISRGDPNVIGMRTEKKYMRGLPDNMMDSVFTRSQPQYSYAREEKSFSPVQRKGPLHIPRMRSRSPSRARSPGPWSSPRRSPDGFGRPEMINRRSPFYRIKRMRSPHQRPVFSDDVDGRRHGSPFLSRISSDMREMGASREPDHPRSFVPNRSPSGRVLGRGTRRFDMMDSRERIENNEYFTGSMHSDRFHDVGSDGSAEGRRICSERRRSFRAPYDSAEVEKFHFHVEGVPRPYRFSPEADSEFHERGILRDREFERRVKNRSGNAPRRTRSVEEHEENYRHGEEEWDGAAFGDVSPAKRRRF